MRNRIDFCRRFRLNEEYYEWKPVNYNRLPKRELIAPPWKGVTFQCDSLNERADLLQELHA